MRRFDWVTALIGIGAVICGAVAVFGATHVG